MKLIALVSIWGEAGRIAPGNTFELTDTVEAESLIARGFAAEVFDTLEEAKQVHPDLADTPDGAIVPADPVDPPADPVVADTVAPADETKTKKAKADAGNSN
jgi:hypothetical protein